MSDVSYDFHEHCEGGLQQPALFKKIQVPAFYHKEVQ